MFRVFLYLATSTFWVAGQSFISMIHQTPVALIEEPGGHVKLTCNHTIPDYYVILWYQASARDTAMSLIGNVYYTTISVETPFTEDFNLSGDGGKEAYLEIKSPSVTRIVQIPSATVRNRGDSAVLRCVHSMTDYNVLLWYRLSEGRTLTLLGHLFVTEENIEPGFQKNKVRLEGNAAGNVSLTISQLTSEDSALYLCGRSLWVEASSHPVYPPSVAVTLVSILNTETQHDQSSSPRLHGSHSLDCRFFSK
ncbi:hypothetical protein DPEC_G00312830 [Dallia pectoralis]|uniref:Uncharacterized protein n=1 Tax=Dallia pectoralis TaxID=75939 RepID=A0ACC2FBY3_DALPE|nr:hypothetical protein DPEC_G00312830 [Dallia pectoralis]